MLVGNPKSRSMSYIDLWSADMSIIPENVAANTNNTAIIVGEKAANIISKELGLDWK